ncbi:uncharacterized protein LOC141901495 [Tubulanus polymorphus]|uniref:uncharacterized protein LOC141901495 n=1 Tax=Tubulanus polymorphus TaxID=672921 RepID=UPI003DA675D0
MENESAYKSLVKELQESTGDPAEVAAIYNKRTSYDEDMKLIAKYVGPEKLAKVVDDYVRNKDCRILDVGAGTGLVAEELRKVGFTGKFDAIEPSKQMANLAVRKSFYENCYIEFVTVDKPCSISTGFYDHVVSCGAIIPGHIKYQALTEMLRMCRTGGYVFACFGRDYLETESFRGFDEFVENLQSDGKCQYEMIEIDEYKHMMAGCIVVLQKTTAP